MGDQEKKRIEFVDKSPDIAPHDIHPSPTGTGTRRPLGGMDLPDFEGIDGSESRWIHCRQCGFILDESVVNRGSGYGNETVDADGDPTVGAGCPFCGTDEFA